ncbi:hypothetical protein C8R47DRAFT_1324843 [Mycena vitilis]|nr:hypothetical protein C8R47DRAFT_1324843 [Mycena vitilis]
MTFSFPPELERELFETTALRYTNTIPTLLRVCRRSQLWIEPLLYRVLVLVSWNPRLDAILSATASKSPAFLRRSVRHVLLGRPHSGQWERIVGLLRECSEITNLVLSGNIPFPILKILWKLPFKNIACSPSDFFATRSFGSRALSPYVSITHVDLMQDYGPEETIWADHWSLLISLPALTHLALPPSIGDILPRVLAECATLVVLVISTWSSRREPSVLSFAETLTIHCDPRVVVMTMSTKYSVEWRIGLRAGDDFWARAERFILRKRAGEIDSTCYLLLAAS